jgi:sigma-B regulation protein RsbU (phosphoserine phosphatase)
MLSALNFSLGERRIEAQFVSLIYALWDDQNRTLRIANSGLPRPLYCHDGKIELIEIAGLPSGLFDDADYDELSFRAKPGDMFVFFSDGILDARNRGGAMFGRGRLDEVVSQNLSSQPDAVVKAIFKAVAEHAAGEEAFDDETVVVISVKGPTGKRK